MMRPVVAALRLRGFKVNAYVIDFAVNGRGARPLTMAAATAVRVEILSLFSQLGIQVHPLKGFEVGTARLPLLGFLVKTTRRLVVLPPARLAKLFGGAKALLPAARLRSWRLSFKTLQRFLGLAVSCQLALPTARFFLRRVYDCQSLVARVSCLTHGAVADLAWFSKVRTEPAVGRALLPVLWES